MLRVIEAWRKGHSVLVQMPTGTGKTHVLAALVNEQLKIKNEKLEGGAVWIVAHRRELVEQIEETVRLFVMHNAQCIMHNQVAGKDVVNQRCCKTRQMALQKTASYALKDNLFQDERRSFTRLYVSRWISIVYI